MVKYTCTRCKKIFKQKIDYVRHINRKRPCQVVYDNDDDKLDINIDVVNTVSEIGSNDPQNSTNGPQITPKKYQCKYCKRYLSRKAHLNRHYTTCKRKKEIDEENKVIYEAILKKMMEYEAKMMEYQSQNQQLAQKCEMLENRISGGMIINNTDNSNNSTNTNTNIDNSVNNTNNGIVNNVSIQINALGNENTDYLTTKDKVEIVEKMHKSIITYIEKIHFNPDHPENHNVYFQNLKNSYGAMFNGGRWETRHISDIIETMMDYGRNKIEEIREELKEKGKMRDYVEGRLDELFNAIDGDDSEGSKNIMKVSEERIKFLAFDNREVVKETMDKWMNENRRSRKKGIII